MAWKRVEYLDLRLQPILGPTYGIMVYQEQVMQIAQVIGGYTLGGADLLRRAMGKKPEEMAQQRDIFVAGAQKNGVPHAKAMQLFDLMEKFAGYGFKVARRGVRAPRLPHRVHEGAPCRRVRGGEPFRGDGRYRQGAPVSRGRRGQRPHRAAAGRQCVAIALRAGRPHHPLRPRRGARHRPIGHRVDRDGAPAVRSPASTTSAAASTSAW